MTHDPTLFELGRLGHVVAIEANAGLMELVHMLDRDRRVPEDLRRDFVQAAARIGRDNAKWLTDWVADVCKYLAAKEEDKAHW